MAYIDRQKTDCPSDEDMQSGAYFLRRFEEVRQRPTQAAFAQLRYELDGLEYLWTCDRSGWTPQEPLKVADAHCGVSWCTSNRLVNYAPTSATPTWFCDEHRPPRETGAIQVPSETPDLKPLREKADDMAHRWTVFRDKLAEKTF